MGHAEQKVKKLKTNAMPVAVAFAMLRPPAMRAMP